MERIFHFGGLITFLLGTQEALLGEGGRVVREG